MVDHQLAPCRKGRGLGLPRAAADEHVAGGEMEVAARARRPRASRPCPRSHLRPTGNPRRGSSCRATCPSRSGRRGRCGTATSRDRAAAGSRACGTARQGPRTGPRVAPSTAARTPPCGAGTSCGRCCRQGPSRTGSLLARTREGAGCDGHRGPLLFVRGLYASPRIRRLPRHARGISEHVGGRIASGRTWHGRHVAPSPHHSPADPR